MQWQQAAQAQRTASAAPMQRAVQSFFGLQLAQAGRSLDEAYFTLRQPPTPTPLERMAIALRLQITPVCVTLDEPSLNLQLIPFYALDSTDVTATDVTATDVQVVPSPATTLLRAAVVELAILDRNGVQCFSQQLSGAELMSGFKWRLDGASEGDYFVELTQKAGTEAVTLPRVQVSVIKDARARVNTIDSWLKVQAQAPQRTDESETVRLTLRHTLQILRSQLDARPLETDYPVAHLLKQAESIVAAPSRSPELLQAAAHESVWLTLSYQRQSLPVRVHMPAAPESAVDALLSNSGETHPQTVKLPVLIAFHGAGGSENMFFETYGAGRLIELASARGWVVVAPRHPLLGMPLNYRQMLEVLSHFFPIDSERVFLVGHSMGGAEVVRQVSLDNRPPQAAIVIGGGGLAKDSNQVKQTPWLVAAGELDFGRGGAKTLQGRLKELGCRTEYREYASVEHMVIVQAALDDVFHFLDQL